MRQLSLSIAALTVIVFGARAYAQDAPPAAPVTPQYYTLSLPAGASLISSPLDTGTGLAVNTFLGLPPQYPLLFGWDTDSQAWVSSADAPAGLAHGFWIYLTTPTTLVVAGQPFSVFTSVNTHLEPGWHLFGVPFEEGVGWQDFNLYVSGNPISLDTAINIGWIDSQVTTVQGSQVQVQTAGQPLLPGVAYWVHTTVPLQLRADRQSGTSSASAADTASSQSTIDTTASPTSPGDSTGSTVMGWLSAIADFLGDVAKGAVAAAEGNWASAGFDWAGGAFGLIEYGLNPDAPDSSSQLNTMETQLDGLIGNVNAIQNQVTDLNTAITGLTNYIYFTNDLGANLTNAETWLKSYYTGPTQTLQSRNWARWWLAGCIPPGQNPVYPASCPEISNAVTTANVTAFQKAFITNPGFSNLPQGGLPVASDDFPLWWSYAVLGNQSLIPAYVVDGTKAADFVNSIYAGLTTNAPGGNALMAYMQWIFSQDAKCNSDVSNATQNAACDLFNDIYLPTEAYFMQVLGDQTQLAEAVVEADNVLAEKFPATYGNAASLYMDGPGGFNQQVNEEVEAFLEVAEQIALYQAADGTQDWNTFGNSNGGQLLARADFVAVQLGRQPDTSNPNLSPPWPASGEVGRVFYTIQEGSLQANQTRGVCLYVSANQPNCSNPVAQISENISSNQTLTGDWPYLLWSTSGSGKSILATGTPNTQWKMQRLTPLSLPGPVAGQDAITYVVDSTVPARLGANLLVTTYNPATFKSEAFGTTGGIVFGSLNGVEGPIGKYGLSLGESPWTITGPTTTHSGGTPPANVFQVSYSTSDAPGAGSLDVTYPPIAIVLSGEHASSVGESWSASANIELVNSSSFPRQHVHWPTSVNVNLTGGVTYTYDGDGVLIGGSQYYSSFAVNQQLLDSTGKTINSSGSPAVPVSAQNQCPGAPFNTCTMTTAQPLDVVSLGLAAGTMYTLQASFASQVLPYSQSAFTGNYTFRSSGAGSSASWTINAPMITLTTK